MQLDCNNKLWKKYVVLTSAPSHPNFLTAPRPEILSAVRQVGVNLCIWQRPPVAPALVLTTQWTRLHPELALDVVISPVECVRDRVQAAPFAARLLSNAGRALLADVDALVECFRQISRASAIRVRLEAVLDDACAVFHADTLSLRLLCTYRGPGTQWLENGNVRRNELGLRNRSPAAANAAIAIDPARIRTAPEWHVLVFKGRGWPGEEDNALIHRSHPVCCRDHYRLRLCLDIA